MGRVDVKDKDPFANTDAEPKDNVSASGFFARLILRNSVITSKTISAVLVFCFGTCT